MDRKKMKTVHWLKPRKMVELAFNERTSDGYLTGIMALAPRNRSIAFLISRNVSVG